MTIRNLEDIVVLLRDVLEVLYDYSDVLDGDDGQPRPNRAMSMMTEVERAIKELEEG
jgi:hypothetical protein